MFKFDGLHLSTRIIIAISMLVSVIFIIQSVYSIGKNDAARIKALDLRAQLTIATQAIALAGPLWDYDKERAKGNLRGMLEDPDIISVQVVDDAGEQFLSFNTGESIEREQPIEVSPFIEVFRDIEYINDDKTFDFDKLFNVTYQATLNLNKIIDGNYYPVEEAKNSNLRHRPIGLGVQGLADAFILMGYPFESNEAKALNK